MSVGTQSDDVSQALPVQAAYDLSASFYDDWAWQRFWRAHEYPVVRDALERQRRGRKQALDLLDVGCGTGWYLEHLRDLCRNVVGVDLSGGMLAVAGNRLPGTLLKQGDARNLDFPSGRFDTVVCTRVLSHMAPIRPALFEMRRVLGTTGTLVLSDVDASHEYEVTRLPVAKGHIPADTHKHDREELFATIEDLGFVLDRAFLIHAGGQVEEIRRPGRTRSVPSVSGWVSAWRRSIG
jgi:ubiquinone/menaquinone biosynthesis C-methylase UbiE